MALATIIHADDAVDFDYRYWGVMADGVNGR